jgi:flagellar motor switch protein FliN/FliY
MSLAIPYDWLKQIPASSAERQLSPLLGTTPAFPWEQFAAIITKLFQLENFALTSSDWRISTPETFTNGLGSSPLAFHIDVAPLEGSAYILIAEEDVNRLMSAILTKGESSPLTIPNPYRQGFCQFLALEIFNIFNKLEYDRGLTPHLLTDGELPTHEAATCDFTVTVEETTCTVRMILDERFRQTWKERFAARKMSVPITPQLADSCQVVISAEAGRTEITLKDWQAASIGDLLLLDQMTLDPSIKKGRVHLTLGGKLLFRAKVKDGSVAILETPQYYEVSSAMAKNENDTPHDDDFEFDDFDTDNFDATEDEEYTTDEELSDFSEDLEEESPPAPKAKEHEKPAGAADDSHAEEVSPPAKAQPTSNKNPLAPENINLTVVVEVARIQISVQKLMELQPGHLLELDVHPEDGVDLVVNGNLIGRGELLKIGDILGVRLLDKG